MISPVNVFDQHVGARLLEFFDSRTPWHRGLWNVGSVLALREVIEAAEAGQAGALSDAAIRFLASRTEVAVGRDPGIGPPEERRILQQALRDRPILHDLNFHTVALHIDRGEPGYLRRWADALRSTHSFGPERTARAIAAHLLDRRFSPDYLHRWWKFRLLHQEGERSLSDLVDEANDLAAAHPRPFEVLIAFETALDKRRGVPTGYLPAEKVTSWLDVNGFDRRNLRQDGGTLLHVEALDAVAATQNATEILDRFAARLSLGSGAVLRPHPKIWIRGEREPVAANRAHRGVAVRALAREKQIYLTGEATVLDASLELLSHLQTSSPSAAVAGGWAAIEALLSDRSDRSQAADRLAMIVACSFPRAELTFLSYVMSERDSKLAAELDVLDANRDRAATALRKLGDADLEKVLSGKDRAAAARMRTLAHAPTKVLADVHAHLTDALRRMYRLRNLILHLGKTETVCLRASLRTAAPIVGAGFDRIVHAHYVEGMKPLELAARARTALSSAGTSRGPSCVDLLS